MEIPIIVEPGVDNGFRASSGGLWGLETEAPTREDAVQRLRELIGRRLDAGAEVLSLEIRAETHPLGRFAGIFKDDPLLPSWKLAMADYRRESENLWEPQ